MASRAGSRFPNGSTTGISEATVLVVDPDDGRRAQFSSELRQSFGRVVEASSTETALYVCTHRRIDLAMVQQHLPGMGAGVLLDLLRQQGGPPVVSVIEHEQAAERASWLDAGGADCIDPRDDTAAVVARCRALLRRRSSLR